MAKNRHSLLIKSLIALAALIIGSTLFLTATKTHDEVAGLAESTDQLNNTIRYIRWTALVLLITFWENVVEIYGSYRELSKEQIEYAKNLQVRVGAMLVAFDLLVIEGLPAKLIELM